MKYAFSETERLELGKHLSIKSQELLLLENLKKTVASEYRSQMSVAKEQIRQLSEKVALGYEMREIPCLIAFHTPVRSKKTISLLNSEESWVEKMTDAELFQAKLQTWQEKRTAAQNKPKATDEAIAGTDRTDIPETRVTGRRKWSSKRKRP